MEGAPVAGRSFAIASAHRARVAASNGWAWLGLSRTRSVDRDRRAISLVHDVAADLQCPPDAVHSHLLTEWGDEGVGTSVAARVRLQRRHLEAVRGTFALGIPAREEVVEDRVARVRRSSVE